jgi:D-methionine transport system substrate-binding protein
MPWPSKAATRHYVNILSSLADNKDNVAMQEALAKALNSAKVKAFIAEKVSGAVVPAF